MGIERLDHVNAVTTRLADIIAWYETVLGLTAGPRPDFSFPRGLALRWRPHRPRREPHSHRFLSVCDIVVSSLRSTP